MYRKTVSTASLVSFCEQTWPSIPCDLHLEHLNQRLKTFLRHLGSNLQKTCIERAAKSIGVVHKVCEVFEMETRHKCESDKLAIPGSKKDFDLIMSSLKDTEVFVDCPGRSHSAFCNIKEYWVVSMNKSFMTG